MTPDAEDIVGDNFDEAFAALEAELKELVPERLKEVLAEALLTFRAEIGR